MNTEQPMEEHGWVPPSPERKAALLQAARSYAARGWAVFPVSDGPIVKGIRRSQSRKEPSHPLQRTDPQHSELPDEWGRHVSKEPAQIHTWWERWPMANIGLATGTPSDLLVLHVDRNGAAVQALLDQLPVTVTASAGFLHDYYFHMPQTPVPITYETGSLPVGIHVRGDKQYVLAPPSIEVDGPVSGFDYDWDRAPDDTPLASLPAFICERIQGWPEVAATDTERAHIEDAKRTYLPGALEQVNAGNPRAKVAKRLATQLRTARLDMFSEAAPVIRAFVAQVHDIPGRGMFSEKDALNLLKQAYRDAPPKGWRPN